MNAHFKHIAQSTLVRDSAKLLSANVIAQVIGIIVYPILTRIYSPEDFGVLNLFLSIGSIFILLSTADYQQAIVLPKQEKHGIALVHLTLFSSLCVFIFILASVPFSTQIATLLETPSFADWYFLLPFYVLFTALWNILSFWYLRHAEYNRNSSYQIMQSSLSAGLKIGLKYVKSMTGGLIVASVIAPILSLVTSCLLAWKKHIHPLFHGCSQDIREVATSYRKFPLYSFPSSILNLLSAQLPIILLTPIFGNTKIGLWSMAILLGFAPLSMISKTLNQTLYQHTVDLLHQQRDIRPIYRSFSTWALSLIIPTFTLLWMGLPMLTSFILGNEWEEVGHILRWMLPWLAINTLTASTGFLAGIFFKQQIELCFEIACLIVRAISIVIGIYTKDFQCFVIVFSLTSFAVSLAHYLWLMILVKRSSTN